MTISKVRLRVETSPMRPGRLLPLLILVLLLLGAGNATALMRGTVLARAQKWIDVPVPYSQHRYYGGYRTDCSGFTSMSWALGRSLTTRSLHNVSHVIAATSLKPGDAMIKYDYHARIFYGWADAAHTRYVTYEETSGHAQTNIKNIQSDLAFGYKPYRLNGIADGPQPWNLVANDSFNVWAYGSPVWWVPPIFGSWVASRTDIVKVGTSALGLINRSARSQDVVDVSQIASVTAGVPYTMSVVASTSGDPAGLRLDVRFLDAAGDVLTTRSTAGDAWKVGVTSLRRMSLTATAPADAVVAEVRVLLSGGTDASGSVGATAVVDTCKLYDSSPVTTTCTVSATSVARYHTVSLRGRVNAPVPAGTVRVYVVAPGRSKPAFLADRPLASGTWSMSFKPTVRGTYTFTAKYLGYGPYGPVTSVPARLRVK